MNIRLLGGRLNLIQRSEANPEVKRLPCSHTCPPSFPEPPLRPFTAARRAVGRRGSTVEFAIDERPSRFPRCRLHHLTVQTKFLVFNIVAAVGSQTCRHCCVQRQGTQTGLVAV